MRTTKFLAVITGLLITFGLNAQVFTKYEIIRHRGPEAKFNKTIKRGIRSGELTRGEVKDLKRTYYKIQQLQHRALRNGHLSRGERRRINHAMNDFDRLIHRYLHNRRDRNDQHFRKHGYRDWENGFRDQRYDDNYDYYHKKGNKKSKHYRH